MHNIFEDFAMTLTSDRTLWFKTIAPFFFNQASNYECTLQFKLKADRTKGEKN